MKIACIGWGSLIWKPEALLVEKQWHDDGPELPVEFLRQSSDGRLTLVISREAANVTTLWALMTITDLDAAKASLQKRERCPERNIGVLLRNDIEPTESIQLAIFSWLKSKDIDAVIWTNLATKFDGINGIVPTMEQAVAYLQSLEGESRLLAEAYIRKAPPQITTLYRKAFEKEMGWTPL